MIKYNIKIKDKKKTMGATHNLWSQCEQQLDCASGANLRAVIDPAGSAVVDVLVVWPFTDLFISLSVASSKETLYSDASHGRNRLTPCTLARPAFIRGPTQ
jgi:hypothetical protein